MLEGKNGTLNKSPSWTDSYKCALTWPNGSTVSVKNISSLLPGSYTVTIFTGDTCTKTKNFVTLSPNGIVNNMLLNKPIWSGLSSTLLTFTSGFTSSGTVTIAVQKTATIGTTQRMVNYTITLKAKGCSGATSNYRILVDPKPSVPTGTQI